MVGGLESMNFLKMLQSDVRSDQLRDQCRVSRPCKLRLQKQTS